MTKRKIDILQLKVNSSNLDLTKNEMQALFRLVCIGDCFMFSHLDDEEEDPCAVEHQKVIQKIFALAHEVNIDDIVYFDDSLKEYFETQSFEAEYLSSIEDYDKRQQMEGLAIQLAARDLVDEVGEDVFTKMDQEEGGTKLLQLIGAYETEFSEHGLNRLHLLNVSKKS